MVALTDFFTSFVLGLLMPLTAVCIIPLYPAFLVYLSNKLSGESSSKTLPVVLGLIVASGVILFMALLGLIFTTFLRVSLTKVISIVSPIAFGILALISLLLIFNIDTSRFFPIRTAPIFKSPLLSAFSFGFFFGAIVIPCNPALIAAFFTKTITITAPDFITNMLNFLSFGIGVSFPLLLFSVISSTASTAIINFLTKHKRITNLLAGIIMLSIALYYLLFVFRILPVLG